MEVVAVAIDDESKPATLRYNTGYTIADVWAIRSDVCGPFCDAEPTVSFLDEHGIEVHQCRECYERPCGRCFGDIERNENRRKGLCQDCREEIRLLGGDNERGIQKEPDSEQTKLIAANDGGNVGVQ